MGGKSCCDFLSHSCIQRQGDVLLVVLEFVLFSILFFIPEYYIAHVVLRGCHFPEFPAGLS